MKILGQITRRSVIALAAATLVAASAANADDFYEGKTITVIVGASAGSGGDVSARTFMAGLAEQIPGGPNIIVRNMEGAGGAVALNFTYEKADPDGLTFYYGNWDPMAVLAGGEGIRFVPEEFGAIGSAANERGTVVRTDAGEGIAGPADIANVKGLRVGRPLIQQHQRPDRKPRADHHRCRFPLHSGLQVPWARCHPASFLANSRQATPRPADSRDSSPRPRMTAKR